MSASTQDRRVVVTGMGVIHQLGQDVGTFWSSLIAGKSGVGTVTRCDITDYTCKVGSEVTDFDPGAYMDPKEARRTDRYVQMAVAATKVALQHGGIDVSKLDADRFGVVIGSGVGGMETIDEQSKR